MKQTEQSFWSLAKLIRFEQYRANDQDKDEEKLAERDRAIYHQHPEAQEDRSRLYQAWLHVRQNQQQIDPDAATIFQLAASASSWFVVLLGLLLGAGVSGSALSYDGSMPVNVALFLGLVIAPQLLLLLFLVITVGIASGSPARMDRWYRPITLLTQWVMRKLWRRISKGGTTEQQQDQRRSLEVLKQSAQLYQPLMTNRALRLSQLLGISFNLGVLGWMWILLAFTDRAFGWQSSLTDSAEAVHAITTALATPWTLLLGSGVAMPTLEQIANSHIMLNSNLPVSSDALRAWWPFMMMCVLIYGLVPRTLVWLYTYWREHQLIAQVQFDSYHYQSLWRRMRSVALRSRGETSEHSSEAPESHTEVRDVATQSTTTYVLEDSLTRYPEAHLSSLLSGDDSAKTLKKVTRLEQISPSPSGSLNLILEGWQPPIEETLAAISTLANALDNRELHLLLLGKPSSNGGKPLTPRLVEVWRKKLDQLQQTNIIVHADTGEQGATH